ncbi:hypothetical protein [Phreatobacter oligotrophus]|uniref:Uncharacterized protein n=1 Tax=Phreatobacter oligotrophus TaxID=1122261 RepID=A0A2T4ZDW1_9HYPH|nr:hypothetical protein [Phreatobacter oligotrophus]PTM60081.1 hypothetical protein C8P69_1035 [Phreatobacter oligotrophus]
MDAVVSLVALIYVIYAAWVAYPLVRRHMMEWYQSSSFFFEGRSVTQVFISQLMNRLGWECFILFCAAVFGAVGGWILVLKWRHDKAQWDGAGRRPFLDPAQGFVSPDGSTPGDERVYGRQSGAGGQAQRDDPGKSADPGPHPHRLEDGEEAELRCDFDDEVIARSLDLIMKWGAGAFFIFAFDEYDGFYIQALHEPDGILLEIMGPTYVALDEDVYLRLVGLGFQLVDKNLERRFSRLDAYTGVLRKAIREAAAVVVPGARRVSCTFAPR